MFDTNNISKEMCHNNTYSYFPQNNNNYQYEAFQTGMKPNK